MLVSGSSMTGCARILIVFTKVNNREKDRVTIEKTFEALFKLVQELDEEESRALREGLDEESLAIFDLLRKPGLNVF